MALDPYAELPAIKDALAGSKFEESVDCIVRVFEESGIKTVDNLDNSPRYLTCSICSVSTHGVIHQIRAYMEGLKDGSIVAPSEIVPEVKEPEPKKGPVKVSKSRSRSSRQTKTKKE